MKLFGINKIMGHCRSSDQKRLEAGQLEVKESHSESLKGKSEGDAPESSQQLQQKSPVPKKPCPNGETPPGENLYILKNCDHCADFTVGPCKKCRCARRPECSRQCHNTPKPTSQESMSPEEPVSIDTPPSTTVPEPSRHLGGKCGPQVCQVCRQQEVTEKHTCLCTNCNAKIQDAVNEVYVQCQGQCQKEGPSQAPPPTAYQPGQQGGQWQQFNQGYNSGDRNANPYNIIVVQDCDNHAFMEQLTSAISRGAPQAGGPQMGGPQRWNPPNNGFQNVGGVVDYQYLDLNGERGGYDNPRDGGYDYGYEMGRPPMDEQYLPEFEDRYARRDSRSTGNRGCNRNTCPRRTESNQFPEGERKEDATTCTCNCPICRKGFETKEKLAMLIAQALEIFIMGYQAKQSPVTEKKDKKGKKDKKDKKDKKGKDNKDNKNNKQRKGKGMHENRPKALPRSRSGGKAESGPSSPASSRQNFPQDNSQYPNFALPSKDPNPYNRDPGDSLENTSNPFSQGSKNSNPRSLFQGSSKNFQKADRISQGSKNSQRSQNAPPPTDDFFLPNCQEHRCKYNCGGLCSRPPHNCGKACKGHCRGACSISKSGAGDGRSRSKNRGPQLPAHRHSRCEQCNKIEGRQWQEVDSCPGNAHSGTKSGTGCAGCGNSQDRNEGGGSRRGRNTLMGLSPIAHYRPGMLQFPVNYLLAGTQFRRRLSRTAAGVTLHQRPYVDEADVKDLPIFPLKRQESTLDTPVPPKKWL
ncbi:uncharacterized protein [Drosophila bipectinata]|uniref:uncharacterized protein n=1 Tax=Drosophila bipectinata TaxID=42026 RepID=UPI001C899C5D|nr:uncharacterized protein LOC122321288 [Drosophila bipectinata]